MFLKQKRYDPIKGRGYADGRKQCDWMTKEETSSHTLTTHALILLPCMIDAKEGRDVAMTDILRAFLQTEYNKGDTHIWLEGPMLDLLTHIDPSLYMKYIHTNPKPGRRDCMLKSRKSCTAHWIPYFYSSCEAICHPERWHGLHSKSLRLVMYEQDDQCKAMC